MLPPSLESISQFTAIKCYQACTATVALHGSVILLKLTYTKTMHNLLHPCYYRASIFLVWNDFADSGVIDK